MRTIGPAGREALTRVVYLLVTSQAAATLHRCFRVLREYVSVRKAMHRAGRGAAMTGSSVAAAIPAASVPATRLKMSGRMAYRQPFGMGCPMPFKACAIACLTSELLQSSG